MKKLAYALLVLIFLPGAALALLINSGVISASSLKMIANTQFGIGVESPSMDKSGNNGIYQLPPGFTLQVYADDVPKARFLRFTPLGDLLVSRPHKGDVVLLRKDKNGDGRHDGLETVVDGLNRPQGIDFHQGWLYIAEREQVGRVRFDKGRTVGDYESIITGLTGDGNHWSKTLRFGPDGKLYLAQGSTCNVCVEEDERRATMMRFNPDGSGGEIFATGLRNSVGFDWSPWDNGLYATDNGRDLLGDDFPVCELNLVEEGNFYGWPYFNDNNVPDPDMGPDPQAANRTPTSPAHGFKAHNAPLGMTFVETNTWEGDFERVALVALHGSWNRSSPDGYKVVSLHFTNSGIEERDFLWGFNQDGDILGRPVDVLQGPDAAMYVSDDYAGAVYRISQEVSGLQGNIAGRSVNKLDEQAPPWLATSNLTAMATEGAQLYQHYNCASCHESIGTTVSLKGLNERLGYNAVIESLREARAPMPLFPLTELQQKQIAVYLLQPDDISDSGQ